MESECDVGHTLDALKRILQRKRKICNDGETSEEVLEYMGEDDVGGKVPRLEVNDRELHYDKISTSISKHQCSTVISMIKTKESAWKQRDNTNGGGWIKPSIDYRDSSVFPLPQELISKSFPQLSPVVTKGPYQSIEHYLNVQFHLLREDFLIPLRQGIQDFKLQNTSKNAKFKRIDGVRFYRKVMFLRQVPQQEKIVYEVDFGQKERAKINWKLSQRILFGSIVCFSNDSFRTVIIGVVVNRDIELLRKGKFYCEIIGEINEVDLFHEEYIMAESKAYFEAYHYTLKVLKLFDEYNFPLREYIIDVSNESAYPNYLGNIFLKIYKLKEYNFLLSDIHQWPSLKQLKVNVSQFEALYSALTKNVALIQGPPGTGKTYLGLKIVKILLENSVHWKKEAGPILVLCYTNHALDQFLEEILVYTKNLLRIGGMSKNEKVENYNIKKSTNNFLLSVLKKVKSSMKFNISKKDWLFALLQQLRKKAGVISLKYLKYGMGDNYDWFSSMENEEDNLLLEWLLCNVEYNDYRNYCEVYHEEENISQEIEDVYACSLMQIYDINKLEYDLDSSDLRNKINKFKNVSEFMYLKHHLSERILEDQLLIEELRKYDDPDDIDPELRWVLYHHWLSNTVKYYEYSYLNIKEEIENLAQEKLEIEVKRNLYLISTCDVIGMTITGATKQHNLIQKLGPKIVIVEEAAEVMESHLVAALPANCEHLIMIGDHKQLRPTPAVYKLSKEYNLDISLFERLINNGLPNNMLNLQHRMRPEIADLIVPAIYPSLKNHESVLNYENIRGLNKNVFFLTHTNPETSEADDFSKKNTEEALFLIALSEHLVLQGYKPSQITILSAYKGQMFSLVEERNKSNIIQEIKITVVDNYQGEENDIILLSLVRNNSEGKIGFLSVENRVCVALSRAKKGLYIMGNIDMLAAKSLLWQKIKSVLEEKEEIGSHLTLQCINHPSELTTVCKAKDFIPISEGGCTKMCDAKLYCGHACKKRCHTNEHNKKCSELVTIELPECHHSVSKECYINASEVQCLAPCTSELLCGHSCPKNCHVKSDPDHLNYICVKPCLKNNLYCKADHRCQLKCSQKCKPCTIVERKKLPKCDHNYLLQCCTDPESFKCILKCGKMLPCGHECPLACGDECGGCQVKVTKEIPDCKHEVEMECGKIPVQNFCTMKCNRILTCGHVCGNICGLPCDSQECLVVTQITAKAACEHDVPLLCCEINKVPDMNMLQQRCEQPCGVMLLCDHICKGTCMNCLSGKIHLPCQEYCGKTLICGHSCPVPCSMPCPPCKKECYIKCKHSKCNLQCGYPCSPCKEKCDWECEHHACKKLCGEKCDRPPCEEPCQRILKCGHPCIGFCGEQCPKLCRICETKKLEDILCYFGSNGDVEIARFIKLPDCKHTIDSYALDKWMQKQTGVIIIVCPQCCTPIQNVNRYGNILKENLNNILKVKRKVHGLDRNNREAILMPLRRLKDFTKKNEFRNCRECIEIFYAQVIKQKGRLIDGFILNSYEVRLKIVLLLVENYKKWYCRVGIKPDLQAKVDFFIKAALNCESISKQEHHDLICECIRLYLELLLSPIEAHPQLSILPKGEWYTNYRECRKILDSVNQFPKDSYKEIYDRIDGIYKVFFRKTIMSRMEFEGIVNVIDMKQSMWNLCPNGHVYLLGTRCSDIVEKGRCPE